MFLIVGSKHLGFTGRSVNLFAWSRGKQLNFNSLIGIGVQENNLYYVNSFSFAERSPQALN